MIKLTTPIAMATILLAGSLPVHASSSDWHHVEGASIRLVTQAEPDDEGRLRGALQIRLKPGWKTYWLDPGSSGVPPTLTATAGGLPVDIDLHFPEPRRFEDDYAPWAGYDQSVNLAVSLDLPAETGNVGEIEAEAFLGVCEAICIPVQARLHIKPLALSNSSNDEAIVENTFAALPAIADAAFHARATGTTGDTLIVEAKTTDGAEVVDIFVAGNHRTALGVPTRQPGSIGTFAIPVHGKVKQGDEFAYTLTSREGAVSGQLRIP